jgi:hypothetical protein
MMITLIAIAGSALLLTNICWYVRSVPQPHEPPARLYKLEYFTGYGLYFVAYALSILRLPFAALPYLLKLTCFLLLNTRYRISQNNYFIECCRITGDFANVLVTGIVLTNLNSHPVWVTLAYFSLWAEIVRLLCEKGQMIFSAIWQLLPHRTIANAVHCAWGDAGLMTRYVDYYRLDDHQRTLYVLQTVKARACKDKELSTKLEYTRSLRIVPRHHGLRGGHVRDIACGEIFIHRNWTNDPWLLIGQVLRRSPWMFDPRYLRRPFYYRSESNRLATLCVLCHASYCLPYAIYQFGHEIKAARYDTFYRLLRMIRIDIEPKVQQDGTFSFDQFINWLARHLRNSDANANQSTLLTDEEVINQVLNRWDVETLNALQIAQAFTYPLKYVEEVLWSSIQAELANHPKASLIMFATTEGVSQCG